jgi:hypothetical protein
MQLPAAPVDRGQDRSPTDSHETTVAVTNICEIISLRQRIPPIPLVQRIGTTTDLSQADGDCRGVQKGSFHLVLPPCN